MILKRGDTFLPKSNKVPCSLACATMPKIGMSTPEMQNPKVTSHHKLPDLNPKSGGKTRLPAPKKREKRAKAVIVNDFLLMGC